MISCRQTPAALFCVMQNASCTCSACDSAVLCIDRRLEDGFKVGCCAYADRHKAGKTNRVFYTHKLRDKKGKWEYTLE